MGFRSLFNRKKKLLKESALSASTTTTATTTGAVISRAPSLSLHSRAHFTEELEKVFEKFDVNRDGKISSSELGSIMGSLGQSATKEELDNMIREVDSDGDGYISLEEFIELNTKDIDPNEILENLRDAFSVFDIDGNGSITAEELHNVMASLGDECSLEECQKMIGGVDSDGDGMIDFEEFRTMMMGPRRESMARI
ncbi:probable calcium-binding protein CML25 [Lotus japonicus]|uniref:EF-hand domain-containing protein n=1 Tax=Lotus japonicus TaxID=34305 RepID=I3S3Q8_LOTJA|nr:probable calcium-binding protein CML25 [Lotus japonicus]AFK34900.1 unknown [Lotus japonicus]